MCEGSEVRLRLKSNFMAVQPSPLILNATKTLHNTIEPASVAQLYAHLTCDQEVVGLMPAGSVTFFCGD